MDFAKFLLDNRLKARDIAKYLDIADASVSRYVSGKTNPSKENLELLLNKKCKIKKGDQMYGLLMQSPRQDIIG